MPIRYCLKTESFSTFWPNVHAYPLKTVTEKTPVQNALRSQRIFLKMPALPFSCVRTKTEVFEYDDLINHKTHAIVFPSFKSFRVDWRKRFEYNTCGRVDEASK